MPQQCPHCMTEIHAEATTCPSCGAQRGILKPGWSAERWQGAACVMFIGAGVAAVIGIALGYSVASSSWQAGWRDGLFGFLLLSPFMLFFGIAGLVMHRLIPRMREGWFR